MRLSAVLIVGALLGCGGSAASDGSTSPAVVEPGADPAPDPSSPSMALGAGSELVIGGEELADATALVIQHPTEGGEFPDYANVVVFDHSVACSEVDQHQRRANVWVLAGRGVTRQEDLRVELFGAQGEPVVASGVTGQVRIAHYEEDGVDLDLELIDEESGHRLTGELTAALCPMGSSPELE